MKSNLLILTVFDSKVEEHLQLITAKSIAEADRMFGDACKNPDSSFAKHPEDFTLVHIGEYDVQQGSLIPLEKNVIICNASQHVNQ